MTDQDGARAQPTLRRALPSDYPAYARLFVELLVDDPVPSRELWLAEFAPTTWIAEIDGDVVGYCYFQEFEDTGYVRNLVVAPAARNRGVGRALMRRTAGELRAHGKTSWRLNVRPDNAAALALYAALGFQRRYATKALCFPWLAVNSLPEGDAEVREIAEERDALLERHFALPHGQIARARERRRVVLEAIANATREPSGLAVFDPKFPGAFPFCAAKAAVRPLLDAMRPHVPNDDMVNLVVERDEALCRLLQDAGASLKLETLHLVGAL